jgi:hypothetical protein
MSTEYQDKEQDRRITNLEEKFTSVCQNYNHEIGEVRDRMSNLDSKVEKVQTDVDWLKRAYWLVATASVGALITALVNFATKR